MSSYHRIWRRLVLLIFSLLVGTVLLPTAHAHPTTQQAPNSFTSLIFSPQMSPDGQFIVYQAVKNNPSDIRTLYSVPITGGPPIELDGPAMNYTFTISPDSTTVVYFPLTNFTAPIELYSIPITGGALTKLNASPVPNSYARDVFAISPDSSTVVHRAIQDTGEVNELYAVPITGGTPTRLNPAPVPGGEVKWGFTLSPDGTTVVYVADQETDNIEELYAVPISGGTPTKLSNHLVEGTEQEIKIYRISPDGTTVVYVTENNDLYQVPITGGTPKLLDSSVNWHDIQFSPDSSNVVYRENERMRRIPLEWGDVFHIHPYNSGGYYDLVDFSISPDSSRVVFRTRNSNDRRHTELHSATVSPGGPGGRRLDPYVSTGFHVTSFKISPDSSTVVYTGRQETGGGSELYAVPISGGARIKLNAPLENGSNVSRTFISPDGSTVIYTVSDSDHMNDIYAVPITGGTPTLLNPTNDTGHNRLINDLAITPDSTTVVYNWSHQSEQGLYAIPITGGTPIRLD
ncbi:MAG: hypothetical protein AAGF95_08830 [Chloroflexota bacterium]